MYMLLNTFCLLCILEMQEIMRERLLYLILAYRTRSLLCRVLWVLLKVPKAHETKNVKQVVSYIKMKNFNTY